MKQREELPMDKPIHEPNFVRVRQDDVSGVRVAIVLGALLLVGSLMYFNKDRAKSVADRPNPSPMSESGTTGTAPRR